MGHKEYISGYYVSQRDKYGSGHLNNLWRTQRSQFKRFLQVTRLFDLQGKSIVDVGCGYGDLYSWLVDHDITPAKYIGVDIDQDHVEHAHKRLPEECELHVGDYLEMDLGEQDYTICSGSLNYDMDDWLEFATGVLDKMWQTSSIGIVFNLESPLGIEQEPDAEWRKYRKLDLEYWLKYAMSKTSRFSLLHDYMPADYTVMMSKEPFK